MSICSWFRADLALVSANALPALATEMAACSVGPHNAMLALMAPSTLEYPLSTELGLLLRNVSPAVAFALALSLGCRPAFADSMSNCAALSAA